MKLVGTTKTTIAAIRDRTHWNASNIKPVDPVSLGLCSQIELDFAVQKAARKAGKGQVPDAAPVRMLILRRKFWELSPMWRQWPRLQPKPKRP